MVESAGRLTFTAYVELNLQLTQFYFAIYSLYNTVTDTRQATELS